MKDMDYETLKGDHWAVKIDGLPIINKDRYLLRGTPQELGYVQGFKGGLYPEWCRRK